MAALITASSVEAERASGRSEIIVPEGAIVTPQARDRARELGLVFTISTTDSGAPRQNWKLPDSPGTTGAASTSREPQVGTGPRLTFETEGWSHPIHAPLYFPRVGQKVIWHKALNVAFRADPDVLRTFVPQPFELAGDEVIAGVTEHYQPGHGLPVQGASVDVRVQFKGVEGRYRLLVINSADEVLCANREEFGMPLTLGEVRLWSRGNTWWGYGRRGGTDIIRVSMFPEKVVADDSFRLWDKSGPMMLLKIIPSADPNRKPWRQVMALRSERHGAGIETSVGRGAVEFGPSVFGLDRIKPLEVFRATFSHFEGGLLKSIECLWEDRPDPIP